MPCKTYKIGVFFDGTGNNKDFDSSNGRDQQSNIAKLYALYKTGEFECKKGSCMVTADKHYENGIGTYDTQEEHDAHPIQRKYDKGGGGGGARRINAAIAQVTKLLDAHPYHKSDDTKFSTRLIDVFGFSRGAAEARDFVNTFYKRLSKKNKKYSDVHFNFIGIYDTVGSFGEPGNDDDYKPRANFEGKRRMKESYAQGSADEVYLPHGIELLDENFGIRDPQKDEKVHFPLAIVQGYEEAQEKATQYRKQNWEEVTIEPLRRGFYEISGAKKAREVFESYNFNLCTQSAKHIVHMTAHDEVRKNFPLTDAKGSGAKCCVMLGVHSDVGGGYAPEKMERHRFHKTVKPNYFYDANFLIKRAAIEHAKKLNAQGGEWSVQVAYSTPYGKGTYVLQRKVLNDLSNVTLHLMHEQAIGSQVHFKPLPEDENHAILPNIAAYYAYAKAHMHNAYTYDQTEDGQILEATQRHHSSVDPAGRSTHYAGNTKAWDDKWKNDSADGGGNDARYVNAQGVQVDGREHPEQAVKVKRAIFPNKPNDAVKPA